MTDTTKSPATPPAAPGWSGAPAFTPITKRPGLALAVLILGISMALIDTTIVNVALPTIRTSLDASEATLSWIISGYALAYGLALIPAGRIGDRIGHKWVFIFGLALFTVASIACGLATDDLTLIIARVVQGLAGGIFFPPVTALIQLMYPPQQRGRAFAIMGATIGFSTALGPIIGGLLIEALGETDGWRSIFFVNVPFGIIAVAAAFFLLPGVVAGKKAEGADLVGLVLLAGSLVAILVPLIQGQDEGWPLWTYLSIAGGLLLLVAFAFWERNVDARGKSPLVPPRLFSHLSFTGGTILALVYFAAFTSIFFTISILWQAGLGHTALESGLVSIPFAIGSIIGASQSNRLAERLGRSVLVLGVGLVAIGLIATLARAAARADHRPHQLGAARTAARRRHRQWPVHRAERAVHRRDRRSQRGGCRLRSRRHDAASGQRGGHRDHRQRAVRQPRDRRADAREPRERLRSRRDARDGRERCVRGRCVPARVRAAEAGVSWLRGAERRVIR